MAEADVGAPGKKSWSTADAIHLVEVCNTYRHDYFAQYGRDFDYIRYLSNKDIHS